MKLFADCAGKCCICGVTFCLAGHGDDDYIPATAEQILSRLQNGEYPSHKETMIKELERRGVFYKYHAIEKGSAE